MVYRIKYTYNTGDTFSTQDGLTGYLELTWQNLDIAKANLKRIEDHYKMYEALNRYNYPRIDNDKIIEQNKGKDWFVTKLILMVKCLEKGDFCEQEWYIDKSAIKKFDKEKYEINERIDKHEAQYCIKLYTDEGKVWQIHAPWCGYFEALVDTEIVSEDLGSLKIII